MNEIDIIKEAKKKRTEFRINEYLTLKLEEELIEEIKRTVIYVNGERFDQCKSLFLNIPLDKVKSTDDIESIDEAAERFGESEEGRGYLYNISGETEFWAHCSNLQAWAENNYDTRLLHSDLAFPLLERLTRVGDPTAKRVFKEEIAKRFINGTDNTRSFLYEMEYLNLLNYEERMNMVYEIQDKNKKIDYVTYKDEICEFIVGGTLHLRNIGIRSIKEINGLEKIKKIRLLDLSQNQITKIEGLEHLKNLEVLWLSNNNISEIENLENFKNLEFLNLRNNNITEIKNLENLRNLEDLILSRNKISEIKGLETLKKLNSLWLTKNIISELKGLENLTKLEILGISSNQIPPRLIHMLGGLDKIGRAKEPQKFVEYFRMRRGGPIEKNYLNSK